MSLEIIKKSLKNNAWVILPQGSLDSVTSEIFSNAIEQVLAENGKQLLVDMEHVDYISSLGLSTIIRLIKLCKDKNAKLFLCNSQSSVQKIFKLSKLDFLELNLESADPAHPFTSYLKEHSGPSEFEDESNAEKKKQQWLKKRKKLES